MNSEIDLTGVVLKTERLVLREFVPEDLEDFYEYASVEGVGEMAGWPHHTSIEGTKFVLNMFIEEKKTFAVVYDGKTIGSVGIEKYDENLFPELAELKCREIGFVLSKDYWGLGLMPEAAGAVISYCFDTLGLDVIVGGHYSFNDRSRRVQEKLGFKFYKSRKTFSELWQKEDDGAYHLLYNPAFKGERLTGEAGL